jgi:hypothetical protein
MRVDFRDCAITDLGNDWSLRGIRQRLLSAIRRLSEQPWPGRSLAHVLVRSRRLEHRFKALIFNDYFLF